MWCVLGHTEGDGRGGGITLCHFGLRGERSPQGQHGTFLGQGGVDGGQYYVAGRANVGVLG